MNERERDPNIIRLGNCVCCSSTKESYTYTHAYTLCNTNKLRQRKRLVTRSCRSVLKSIHHFAHIHKHIRSTYCMCVCFYVLHTHSSSGTARNISRKHKHQCDNQSAAQLNDSKTQPILLPHIRYAFIRPRCNYPLQYTTQWRLSNLICTHVYPNLRCGCHCWSAHTSIFRLVLLWLDTIDVWATITYIYCNTMQVHSWFSSRSHRYGVASVIAQVFPMAWMQTDAADTNKR